MTESIGTYYTDIRPNAEGFVERMRGPLLPQIDQFGREAGQRFSSSFGDEVTRRLGTVLGRSRPATDRQARDNGQAAGDAFGRAMDERINAAIRALPNIKVDADTSEIDRKLARLRASIGNVSTRMRLGLDDEAALAELRDLQLQLERLTGPGHDIRVRTNAAAAIAELKALQSQVNGVGKQSEQARKPVSLLLTSILAVGPALVPLGGAALAAGAGLVAGAGAGALAFLGVRKEMAAGTAEGAKFAGGVGELKGVLAELEATAAHGVLDGFDHSVDSITGKLPGLDAQIAATSSKVGDIVGHLVGGATGGFSTFGPLIDHVLSAADKLAARFETWASGPGGSKFSDALIKDFDQVGPLLANVATDAVKLVQAFAPAGGTSVSFLTTITGLIGGLPVGVMKAGTTAYIAFKLAVAASGGITAASAALRGFATAETEAAVASTRLSGTQGAAAAGGLRGLAGGMSTIISRATPYVAAWVGIAYATNTGARALGDYEHQMSGAQAITGSTLKTLGDVFTFHWSDIGHDLGGYERQRGFASAVKQMQADIAATTGGARELDSILSSPANSSAVEQYFASRQPFVNGNGPLAPTAKWDSTTQATINQYHQSASAIAAAAKQADRTVAAAQKEYDLIRANVAKGSYEAGAESYDAKDKLDAAKAAADRLHNAYLALIELQGKARADAKTLAQYRQTSLENNQAPKVVANDYILNTATSYSQASTGLAAYQKQLQAASDAEAKWNAVTIVNGKETATSKAALDQWNVALTATHGNVAAATALVLAHQDAYRQDGRDIALTTTEQDRLNASTAAAATRYKLTADQVQLYGGLLGITARQLADGSVSQDQFVAGIGQVVRMVANGGTALIGFTTAVTQFESGLDTAASRAQLLGAAMVALNGDAISYGNAGASAAAANQQLVTDFDKLHKGVLNLKTGMLDYHNAGAQPVLADLAQLQSAAQTFASATYQDEVATKGRTQAAKDAANVYYNDTHGALIAEASQLGLTHDQAKALADQYFHWPKNAKTQIEQLGGDQVKTMLSGILEDLDQITGNHHTLLSIDAQLSPNAQALGLGNVGRLISSGHIIGGVTAKKDGGILDYYAHGGIREDHVAQIAPAGTTRVWAEPETGGEAYIPLAQSKRGRSRDILGQTAARLGGMVQWFESGGFTGVTKPPPPKGTGSTGSGSSGSGSSSAAAAQQTRDLTAEKAAIAGLQQALLGATAQLITATAALYWGAKRAGASDQILATLANERTKLIADSRLLAETNTEIGKTRTYLASVQAQAAQYRAAVTSAGMGQFDITTAGVRTSTYTDRPAGPVSISSITADAKAAADREALEKTQLARLHAMGINSTLYHQLSTGDPAQEAAQLAALSKATPAEIRALNAQYGRLSSATSSLAGTVADQRYGGQISAAQGLLNGVDPKTNPALAKAVHDLGDSLFGAGKWAAQGLSRGLLDERDGLSATMRTLANEMVTQIKRSLGIRSPSRVMRWHGRQIPLGLAEGITAELPAVRAASDRMAMHAVPDAAQMAGLASSGRPAGWSGKLELHGGIVDVNDLIQQLEVFLFHRGRAAATTGGM